MALIVVDIKEFSNGKMIDGWVDRWMDRCTDGQTNTRLLQEFEFSVCLLFITHIEYSFNLTQQILVGSQEHQNGFLRFLSIPGFYKDIWKNKMLYGFHFLFFFFLLFVN